MRKVEMTRKFAWIMCLVITALLSACGRAPERNFSDQDLLVDVSVLPDNWALLDIYTMDNDEGEESGETIIFYKMDTPYLVRAGQYVFRYSSTRRAAWHYRRLEDAHFRQNNPQYTPWTIPEGFSFSSSTADQWRFGCADSTFSPAPEFGNIRTICLYWAQYDEFLVYVTITTHVEEQEMASMDDVYQFISAVDQRMAQYLSP